VTNDAATLAGVLADRSAWRADRCPIGKALQVVGTRSAMLIMREAYYGTTRFDDFAARVGVTEAVAAARLRELTDAGLFERAPYREPGQRTRFEYRLTPAGQELQVVLHALQQWGDEHRPYEPGPTVVRRTPDGRPVHVGFVDDEGREVPLDEVRFVRTSTYPS
jgi:DNA-binding HxlR family transcriptional regulator